MGHSPYKESPGLNDVLSSKYIQDCVARATHYLRMIRTSTTGKLPEMHFPESLL